MRLPFPPAFAMAGKEKDQETVALGGFRGKPSPRSRLLEGHVPHHTKLRALSPFRRKFSPRDPSPAWRLPFAKKDAVADIWRRRHEKKDEQQSAPQNQ